MNKKKRVVFSGIQPSGSLHIGNYLGAIQSWIKLTNENQDNEIYFSIVDYHALTNISTSNSISFHKDVWDLIFDIIALGLDLNKCSLFIQSSIHHHLELFWILSSFTSTGELLRMNQYKEKSSTNNQNFIPASLLNYPILQAADILLYKAEIVPVGEDQKQHLELSRSIAQRFNYRFQRKIFPKPKALLTECPKIMGIDGIHKMSKTYNNYISFSETSITLNEKIMKALTDPNRKRRTDPGNPNICNIFTIHKSFTKKEDVQSISEDCKEAKIGCVDCKKILIHNLWNFIEPIQKRKAQIIKENITYKRIIFEHNKKMKIIANETMKKIRKLLNINYFNS